MFAQTTREKAADIRELSADEIDAVAGGWPKWLERLFGGGGGGKTPGEMTADAKKNWPAGSHWTDHQN